MTALKRSLIAQIAATGPISVATYMNACLFDPQHGYYTTREPFGRAGDFITAPEISQMFGEMLAIWCFRNWESLGRPARFAFAEIGPRRGTLIADMLRSLERLGNGAFAEAAAVQMVETSPRLASIQKIALSGKANVSWLTTPGKLPALPRIIVSNELLDAVPARQFVRTENGWRERMVALSQDGDDLVFAVGAPVELGEPYDAMFRAAPIGEILEISPGREAMMNELAAGIRDFGGALLAIDYGHLAPAAGDTLQAVRNHAYDPVLAHPGEADLTSHVDFAAIAAEVKSAGLEAATTSQGEFLLKLGLAERAGQLGAGKDSAVQYRLQSEVERLARPEAMGNLFKVLGAGHTGRYWMP